MEFQVPQAGPENEEQDEQENEPQDEPQVVPDVEPEIAPEVVPEDEPQVVPEYEPQEELQVVPEVEPDVVPEVEPQAVPEYEPDFIPEEEPQVVPENEPQDEDQVVPEEEPQVVPVVEPQVVPEDEPQVVPEYEPDFIPEEEPQVVPENEPQDEDQVVPEEEPQVVPIVEPQVVPEVVPQAEPAVEPQVVPRDEPQVLPEDAPQEIPENEPESEEISEDEPQEIPETEPEWEEISEDEWYQLFRKGTFKKADMDMMVMDFFIDQEFPLVAEAFHKESGCPLGINSEDLTKVGKQKIVRDLILNRQFDDAIQTLNETMTPGFLHLRPELHFYLQQQKMIELCRRGDSNGALSFSRRFIVWETFDDGYFQRECRSTLLLMLYGDDEESPASALLDYRRIVELAKYAVNTMINYQRRRKGNLIEKASKMVIREEEELYTEVEFPCFDVDSGYPKLYC